MSPAPWLPPTPARYQVEHFVFEPHEWDKFAEYYRARRNKVDAVIKNVLELSGLPIFKDKIDNIYRALENTRTTNDLTGQFGEIISSYILESHQGARLIALSWPETPFNVRKGTDIVGVCTVSWLVICAETKTTTTGSIGSSVRNVCQDLCIKRLWPRFTVELPEGQSRMAVVDGIKKMIRQGQLSENLRISVGDIENIVAGDRFIRAGYIVHGQLDSSYDYDEALELLADDDVASNPTSSGRHPPQPIFPTSITDVDVGDIETAKSAIIFSDWIGNE